MQIPNEIVICLLKSWLEGKILNDLEYSFGFFANVAILQHVRIFFVLYGSLIVLIVYLSAVIFRAVIF